MGSRTGSFTNRPNDISPRAKRYLTQHENFWEMLLGRQGSGGSTGIHFEYIDEVITFAGTATVDTTSTIPQYAIVLPFWTRVVTTLSGASVASFIVGIAGATNRFLTTNTNITAGDEHFCAAHWAGTVAIVHTAAAAAIRVTPDTSATAGALRLVVPYVVFSAPAA